MIDKRPSPYGVMDNIRFTQPGIEKLLKNINQTKAAGPDELPARILKETAKEISGVLSNIFQQSYDEGTVPSDWSTARISSIYKKCDKSTPSNYRPVSLTCITCTIMEHIVCSQIGRHLDYNNILNPNQHGFLVRHNSSVLYMNWRIPSTERTRHMSFFCTSVRASTKCLKQNFSKKIRYYGINGKTNAWISAFFGSRSHQVVNGQSSLSVDVLSGVPQGTLLGPILFLLYINDINEGVNSQMRLFADDSIVYREIQTSADHLAIESDLNKLHHCHWALSCQLRSRGNHQHMITIWMTNRSNELTTRTRPYVGITINTKLL